MNKQSKMQGKLKPMDWKTFKKYDPKARTALKKYFAARQKKVIDNPWTEHEADLFYEDENIFIECEVLRRWKGNWNSRWPHRLFERKRFYKDNKQGYPVIYYVLSEDCRQAWWVKGEDLKDEYLQDVVLKNYQPKDDEPKERMYVFPDDVVHHVTLSNK